MLRMGVVLMPITYIKYISDGYISEKDNTDIIQLESAQTIK